MMKIGLGWNAVNSKTAEREILEVLRSGNYSPGKKVKEFEDKWAKLHKSKRSLFVNSGTDALRLSLLALKEKYNWPNGSEVAVPAITFVASVNTIIQAGLRPFFVDVSMYTYLMNPWNLQHRIQTAHTKLVAVMPVHLFGQRCTTEIFEMAKNYRLKVIEDSCETVANETRGDVSCHSTYMAHHVTTGVGGFASTNDEELADLIWSYGNHGRREKGKFNFDRVGYSSRATEFEAVLGLSQLKDLKENLIKRRGVFVDLLDALEPFEDFSYVKVTDNTCMMFPIEISERSTINKEEFMDYLTKNGIENRNLMPITNQKCYQNIVKEDYFPMAQRLNKTGFYIPCHPGITKNQIKQIAKVFSQYLTKR